MYSYFGDIMGFLAQEREEGGSGSREERGMERWSIKGYAHVDITTQRSAGER
jgi:hypothetical protein